MNPSAFFTVLLSLTSDLISFGQDATVWNKVTARHRAPVLDPVSGEHEEGIAVLADDDEPVGEVLAT